MFCNTQCYCVRRSRSCGPLGQALFLLPQILLGFLFLRAVWFLAAPLFLLVAIDSLLSCILQFMLPQPQLQPHPTRVVLFAPPRTRRRAPTVRPRSTTNTLPTERSEDAMVIRVEGGVLAVEGRRNHAPFRRQLVLSENTRTDRIRANVAGGVLRVTVPKAKTTTTTTTTTPVKIGVSEGRVRGESTTVAAGTSAETETTTRTTATTETTDDARPLHKDSLETNGTTVETVKEEDEDEEIEFIDIPE